MRLVNRRTMAALVSDLEVADTLIRRLRGLIGRHSLAPGCGMLFPMRRGAAQIHTFFMQFPIDVLYLDTGGKVLAVNAPLAPWRIGPLVLRCAAVIELPAGVIGATDTRVGDVTWMDHDS